MAKAKKPESKVDFTPADALKAAGAGYAKKMAMKVKGKVKKALAKAKAMKGKGKVQQQVQKAEDEAKATAAEKNTKAKGKAAAATKKKALAKAKGKAAKSAMKKPASWCAWAEKEEDSIDDGEEEEEEVLGEKDFNAPSKAQARVFDDALKRTPGTRGSLPVEIHEVWNNIQRGPGSKEERHALRNMIVPRDAGYGHVCTIDPKFHRRETVVPS